MTEPAEADLLPKLEDEIRRFELQRVIGLRFSAELETRYQADTTGTRAHILQMQGLVALLAYDFFIVGDYLLSAAHFLWSVVIQCALVTPVALFVFFLLRSKRNTFLLELGASLLCLFGALNVLYVHHGVSSMVSAEAQTELILVLLVVNCMLRVELRFASAITGLTLLLDSFWLYIDHQMAMPQKMFSGGMLGWGAFLALTANYIISRERRYSYLLQLRGWLQRGLLAGINAELLALSATDLLTGLPNRRAYDERFAQLWRQAVERGEPISTVMVDVDFFKRINDAHGHPYGDKVLQRVASLLQQALRAEDDFVARFGGEEFIVVLPGTGAEGALKVAERMRTLVQVAGSPAMQRDTPLQGNDVWTTVSCGVATTWPVAAHDPARLVAEADAALYRAKREGRNRSCSAPPSPVAAKIITFPLAV